MTAVGIFVMILIAATHGIAFRYCPSNRRLHYFILFCLFALPSLFILVADGSGHLEPVIIAASYQLLFMPEFYLSDSGPLDFSYLAFGIPVLHQLISVGTAWAITQTMPDNPTHPKADDASI